MLKTAFKPRWILSLLGALLVATGFVLLSQWQFNRSATDAPPPLTTTETAVPLTSHIKPAEPLMANEADQMLDASGHFLPGKQVLVGNRLSGERLGYWVVAAFAVDGAPDQNIIPVVRGWQPDATEPAPAPTGELKLTGRLLPTEGPLTRDARQPAFNSLSVSELINVWDVDSYSGFLIAGPVTGADGADHSATTTSLVQVEVGPQPQERQINWLNIFYGIEWVVFAGFAVFLWYRLVADDYRRQQEDIADAAAIAAGLDPASVYRDEVLLEASRADAGNDYQGPSHFSSASSNRANSQNDDNSENKDQK